MSEDGGTEDDVSMDAVLPIGAPIEGKVNTHWEIAKNDFEEAERSCNKDRERELHENHETEQADQASCGDVRPTGGHVARLRSKSFAARLNSRRAPQETTFDLWTVRNLLRFSKMDGRIRAISDGSLVVALFCILCMMLQNEVVWAADNEVTLASTVLKSLVSVGTIVQIGLLTYYYQSKLQLLNMRRGHPLLPLTLHKAGLLPFYLLEVAICSFHVPPGVDVTLTRFDRSDGKRVELNMDVLGAWLFARLYLCVRVIHEHSILRGRRGRMLAAANNYSFAASFSMKTVLKFKPFTLLMAIYIVYVMAASWVMHVCERFYDESFHYLPNAIWVVLITMSTVGYGDLTPVTLCGRSVSVVSAGVGLVISALLVTILTRKITLNPTEAEIVKVIKTKGVEPDLRDASARVIQLAFRYYRIRRKSVVRDDCESDRVLSKLVKYAERRRARANDLRNIEASAEEGQDVALLSNEVVGLRLEVAELREQVDSLCGLLREVIDREPRSVKQKDD